MTDREIGIVLGKLEGIEESVKEMKAEIRLLKAERDQRVGMIQLVRFGQGLLLAGIALASYLVGIGHG